MDKMSIFIKVKYKKGEWVWYRHGIELMFKLNGAEIHDTRMVFNVPDKGIPEYIKEDGFKWDGYGIKKEGDDND